MSTIRNLWNCCQQAVAAFFLGIKLFYVVGPLVIGALATMLMLALVVYFMVWPVVRFVVTRVYRLGVWAARGVFGQPPIIVSAMPRPAAQHTIHPEA